MSFLTLRTIHWSRNGLIKKPNLVIGNHNRSRRTPVQQVRHSFIACRSFSNESPTSFYNTFDEETFVKEHIQQKFNFRKKSRGKTIDSVNGLVETYGILDAKLGTIVSFNDGGIGFVAEMREEVTKIVMLSSKRDPVEGDILESTDLRVQFPVGDALNGRIVNVLGQPLDNLGPLTTPADATKDDDKLEYVPLFHSTSTPIHVRDTVVESFQTGVKALDLLHPIAAGNRLGLIGNRGTGKTSLATSIVCNQGVLNRAKGLRQPPNCVYVMIGLSAPQQREIIEQLKKRGAMQYTTVIVASAHDSYALQYLAPIAGAALSDYYRAKGKDSVVVYDDMMNHAEACTQMMKVMKSHGYQVAQIHANLLDRAGKFRSSNGGGSVTAISCVTTAKVSPTSSSYLTSSIAEEATRSVVDDFIYLDVKLAMRKMFPAIDVLKAYSPLSKSAATLPFMRPLMRELRKQLSHAHEVCTKNSLKKEFKIFVEMDEQDEHMKTMKWQHFFKQNIKEDPVRYPAALTALLFAIHNGHTDKLPTLKIHKWEVGLYPFLLQNSPQVAIALAALSTESDVPKEIQNELFWAVERYCEQTKLSCSSNDTSNRAEKYWGILPSQYFR